MLLTVFCLVALATWQIRQLSLQPKIDLLSPEDPIAQLEAARISTFGTGTRLLVGVYRPREQGGVLTRRGLEQLRATHLALARVEGITTVSSLVNAPVLVASAGAPAGSPLWTGDTLDNPRQLWRRLRASDVGKNLLLSLDESLAPIYLQLAPEIAEAEIAREVEELAAAIERNFPQVGHVLVVGPALVETRLANLVLRDLARLVPFSVLVMALGLLLAFRRPLLVAVPLLHVLVLEALVLGGMATTGIPLDLVSVLAPVVLVPVGVADLLHLLVRLEARGNIERLAPEHRLATALGHLQGPMVSTTATTFLGFLGFLLSPVPAIRLFGLTLSVGAVLALLLTFTLDVALLAMLWRPRDLPRLSGSALAGWLGGFLHPRRARFRARASAVLFAVLSVPSVFALAHLSIEDTWIQNFDPKSKIVRDARQFEAELAGINRLSLVLSAESPEHRDRMFDVVQRLTTSQSVVPGLRGALSAPLLVRALDPSAGWMWKPWPTPGPQARAEGFATWKERGLPLPRVETLMDSTGGVYQVQLMVFDQPLRQLVEVRDRVLQEARTLAGPGIRVEALGDLAVNIRMVYQAVRGQARSLFVLCLALTLSLLALTGSPRSTAVLLLPMAISILATYGALVLFAVPYGIAVSMFPTLVVGLAVDFTLHLRAAVTRTRGATAEVWHSELALTLQGIWLNGVVWVLGFGVLTLSALPPNRYLGLLASLVIGLSAVLTIASFPFFKGALPAPLPTPHPPLDAEPAT